MNDPVNREKVELARDFAFHLLKGIKQIGMYRHNEARFPEFMQQALATLTAYHQKFNTLSVKVEQTNFLLLGQTLFSDDSNLPYKFYRDGIRQLMFRPDITIQELVSFTLIAISEPERGADDLLAQLWRSNLEHVEYVVVEGFKMDEYSEEQVQVEVDQVVGYLYQRLRGDSNDFLRFARVSTEDLDVKMEGVDQIRGAVVSGVTATDELKAKLQREVEEDENARLFPKLVSAVFQVVEGGLEDMSILEEMFSQLLDALLMQEDFGTINQVVLKLRAMEQRSQDSAGIAQLRKSMVMRMGEEQRLTRLGDILKVGKAKHPQDVTRYLQALDIESVPTLLTVLEAIEIPENRVLVMDVLVTFCKEMPDPFIVRLGADKPQLVRDMVYVIEKANVPDRLKLFGQALHHKNLAVRLEVMSIIAKGRTGEARKLIQEALNDPHPQVRMQAARVLPEFDREKALVELVRVVRDAATFEKKSPDERTAFYAALGSTGHPAALTLFHELLQVKPNLLNRKKVMEDKLLAVSGLAAVESVQAYKVLAGVVEDKTQPMEVLTAARKAMYQMKKALFGDAAGPEGG
ncbi:MAG TPA: HEAT repeat domain-containing protein [Myxococcaceae bacterium]|nr:HEAT repeat domain-containing protein [Myxococcaceae bacterium]